MKQIIVSLALMLTFLTGCEPMSESALIATANTAGQLCQLTWFSIDDPDCEVKAALKDIVTTVTTTSVQVAEGATYLEAILPSVQELALKQEKLNEYQKTLINAGAVVILNGIDTFLATNEKVKTDAALVSKVVGAFGKGCLVVLNMKDDCCEIKRAKAVFATRSLKCRGGKFIATP